MQTQLTHAQTLSQQRFFSNERDIPPFEEAFDPASLRKFFQTQHSETPLTLCSDSPALDEFQLLEQEQQDHQSIFSSPVKTYMEQCPIVYCLPTLTLQPEVDDGLCTTISTFTEAKSVHSDLEDRFEEGNLEGAQLLDGDNMKISAADGHVGLQIIIDNVFFRQERGLEDEQMVEEAEKRLNEDSLESLNEKPSEWDLEGKLKRKAVFIIERNVLRRTIEKKLKKKKFKSLEKKKKAKKEEGEEQKEQTSEDAPEKKKRKKKALQAMEGEIDKKEDDGTTVKVKKTKKVKVDGEKKVSKKEKMKAAKL